MQALVMGFGGTGSHILTFLKEQAVLKYGEKPESVRFLFFDTIADWKPGETVKILGGAAEEKLAKGREEGTSLDPNTEYFFLGDRDPDLAKHVYESLGQAGDHDRLPHLKDWLHAPWLSLNVQRSRLSILEGAAQQRQIGRFAMFQNAEAIVRQIRTELSRLKNAASGAAINVWLVASSAGGTGAGCLLDAAFLTRLAVGKEKVNVTGVIVLPEIYSDKEGISRGRAYSLFRELDRFQEQEVQALDRFWENGRDISSRVVYDARGRHVAEVSGKLFDNLFYVGQPCFKDEMRTSFFTSVANAIDPFLDNTSGPPLLEAALNEYAAASSFGGARIYVPAETLSALFAWQEVDAYVTAATAARREENMISGLYFGAAEDRRRGGTSKVENVLPLFKELLQLSGQKDEELRRFARRLDPQSIVKEWYGFDGAAVSGMELTPAEEQVARWTYVNPYYSMSIEDPGQVTPQDLVTRTYQEHKSADLPKENKPDSRDRFAAELENVTQRYKSVDAADLSFEKGRRVVFDKLSGHLRQRIDAILLREIEQKSRFGQDPQAPEEGTVMSRLYQELKEILADQGPLNRLDAMVSVFLDSLDGEEERLQQEAIRTLKELKEWKKSGLLGGNVDEPQQEAREAATAYIETYQRKRLLRDVQSVVRDVKARFQEWAGAFRAVFDDLVSDVSRSGHAEISKELRRLNARLHRLAQNPTARFSCSPDWHPVSQPDLEMLGYREKLHRECVIDDEGATLAARALSASSWELGVDAQGRPQVTLKLPLGEREEGYGPTTLGELHRALYKSFRKTIDERIDQRDIFDYLRYVQKPPHNVKPETIAQILNDSAEALINAEAPQLCRVVFKDPVDTDKRNLNDAILRAIESSLGAADVSESPHSDSHSITLLKIKKPSLEKIHNIAECREDYIRWQQEQKGGDENHDKQLARAQVYHPFRPELEAWFIERRHFDLLKRDISDQDHIPPRIVRLLEDPAMMQAFVHCVATGAIEKTQQSWVWHRSESDEDVLLTDPEIEPEADLVRAAVIFTLQQREGRRSGRIRIDLAAARQSAVTAAQKHGKTPEVAIQEFLENGLESFLEESFPESGQQKVHEREKAGLRMIFEFYGHPTTRTPLMQRLALSYRA